MGLYWMIGLGGFVGLRSLGGGGWEMEERGGEWGNGNGEEGEESGWVWW